MTQKSPFSTTQAGLGESRARAASASAMTRTLPLGSFVVSPHDSSASAAERRAAAHSAKAREPPARTDVGSSDGAHPASIATDVSSSLRQEPAPAQGEAVEVARQIAQKAALFRANALRASDLQAQPEQLPQVASGRWVLLVFLATTLTVLGAVGYFGKIDVTSVATGAVVVRGGPRPVLAQASGQVIALSVRAGETVRAGEQLARIDATELRAREQREAETLAVARSDRQRLSASNTQLYARTVDALSRKRGLLAARAQLKRADVAQMRERAEKLEQLEHEGAASRSEALLARTAARGTEAELLTLRQEIADIDLQLSDRRKALQIEEEELRRRVAELEASRTEAHVLVERTDVRAPLDGVVESLLVTEGQVVPCGALLARIIPEGALNRVVVFAPVKDAGFLSTGLDARVEFSSLPVSEYGKVPAKVVRVSHDVAAPQEIGEILGDIGPTAVVRVELELSPGAPLEKVRPHLRSGERVTARLSTRKRRIATLLFDFLRRWDPE